MTVSVQRNDSLPTLFLPSVTSLSCKAATDTVASIPAANLRKYAIVLVREHGPSLLHPRRDPQRLARVHMPIHQATSWYWTSNSETAPEPQTPDGVISVYVHNAPVECPGKPSY